MFNCFEREFFINNTRIAFAHGICDTIYCHGPDRFPISLDSHSMGLVGIIPLPEVLQEEQRRLYRRGFLWRSKRDFCIRLLVPAFPAVSINDLNRWHNMFDLRRKLVNPSRCWATSFSRSAAVCTFYPVSPHQI